MNPEHHLRGFLKIFQHTNAFQDAYKELDDEMKGSLDAFIKGADERSVLEKEVLRKCPGKEGDFVLPPSRAVVNHWRELRRDVESFFGAGHDHEGVNGNGAVKAAVKVADGLPRIYEDVAESRTMEVYAHTPFHNWGLSVENTPQYTFIPRTLHGLINVVKFAATNGFRVRCAGYRHSWSHIFSADKQILISLLNLEEVNRLPNPMSILPQEGLEATANGGEMVEGNEFMTIELVDSIGKGEMGNGLDGKIVAEEGKQLCRVGVSVTNEMFRRWAVKGNKWTLPVDVILVE